jgi:hypothetical protein
MSAALSMYKPLDKMSTVLVNVASELYTDSYLGLLHRRQPYSSRARYSSAYHGKRNRQYSREFDK